MRRLHTAIALAIVAGTGTAGAAPCSDLPNPVYGLGGSANKPMLAKVAKGLAALTGTDQLTIVFQAPGACLGIYALLNDTTITGTASYWNAAGTELSCDLAAGGQVVDFANMSNSAALCPLAPTTLPTTIGDYEGPITTVNLIVPIASSQTVISAAAAYLAFGLGADGQAAPWTVDNELTIRDANSAVQQLLGVAINVPASKFTHGVNGANQNGVITRVAQSANPENAMGIVSGEAADAARATVRTLAYQHTGQTCGFVPDSSGSKLDKKNVRDGRYFLWTAQHFFAKRNATSGDITSAGAAKLIGYFTGKVDLPTGFDLQGLVIQSGAIPQCAMRASREGDLGAIHLYKPAKSCGAFFDSLTGGTTAKACPGGSTDCTAAAPSCNYGYCEVQ